MWVIQQVRAIHGIKESDNVTNVPATAFTIRKIHELMCSAMPYRHTDTNLNLLKLVLDPWYGLYQGYIYEPITQVVGWGIVILRVNGEGDGYYRGLAGANRRYMHNKQKYRAICMSSTEYRARVLASSKKILYHLGRN